MPYTRLQRHTALKRKGALQRKANNRNNAQRAIVLRTTHYKKFCDVCFEFYIRWRDNWTDGIDGRKFAQGDYKNYHACHFIPRAALATRYNPMNCHGQSSGHNWAASPNAHAKVRFCFMRQYRDFMERTYGADKVKELEQLGQQTCTRTPMDWQNLSKELYEQARKINAQALSKRLASVYSTGQEQGILDKILNEMKGGTNATGQNQIQEMA